jgi:RecA-family ATPase
MVADKKTTVPESSIGVDGEQSLNKNYYNDSITDKNRQDNLQVTSNGGLKSSKEVLQTVTMTELYDETYQPKIPVIENLLYNGMYLFAGAPKIGKSFLVAQLGYYVSKGIPLWNYKVNKGTVLYLALEDDYGRLQKRLFQMFDVEACGNFHFATRANTLGEGLIEQLEQFLEAHTDTKLVIIDTFQKVREVGGEQYSYSKDYAVVAKLKAFSDKYNICLLVVHHTRKMESSDSMEMISGSTGLLGAADGAFALIKEKRVENKAVLEVVGRDQQDQKLYLNFNRETCVWELIKTETELWKQKPDKLVEAIKVIVTEEQPEWIGTATELLELLPDMELQPNALARKLNVLRERLMLEANVWYSKERKNDKRVIILQWISKEE